ncbi:MAG: LapA family protein [candidate division Zixibacteria bacterium]|nr:LapA family protein [candidate division Zixibacteria bacterium]MBU1470188.1 LapA family protein [candidate division Zixibacteria bacterium]MBU2625949.1 LapA family protein [candidate division Zixibacteria bacterium]
MPQQSSSGSGPGAKVIFLVIVFVLLIVVLLQNTHRVGFNLLLWTIGMSQALLTLISVMTGFVAGLVAYAILGRKKPGK